MSSQVAAAVFLGALPAAAAAWCLWRLAKSPYTPAQSVVYAASVLFTRVLWGANAPPALPTPRGRGAVLVCNHRSSVDPFFLQLAAGRPIHWVVAREFCEHWAFRAALRFFQVIPTSRGGIDAAALRAAIRLVEGGGLVGMFPEGRVNMTDAPLLPVRPGAALVALKAGAPLIPCFIEGSPYDRYPWSPFFMTARVRARIGEPIPTREALSSTPPNAPADAADAAPAGESDAGAASALILRAMQAVAALGGHADFPVKLAGRDWKPTRAQLDHDMKASRQRRKPTPGEGRPPAPSDT